MFAIQCRASGPPEDLTYRKVPDPSPTQDQVRVSVKAAGVTFIDTERLAGKGGWTVSPSELPMIPGREVAGVVDAVGDNVAPDWLNRHVVAHLGTAGGGYAQLAIAPVNALHEIPHGLNFAEAVAMIGTGRTAMSIIDVAAVTSNDVVLVTAAAGGLGGQLIQAAKTTGAVVIGLAGGADKTAHVRGLGANLAVDYRQNGWEQEVRDELTGHPITAVLDSVGGTIGRAAFELIGAGGRMLMFGWASGEPTPITTQDLIPRSLTVTWAVGARTPQTPAGVHELEHRALAAATVGQLSPHFQTFPLERAAEAHNALQGRTTVGKVVLTPTPPKA